MYDPEPDDRYNEWLELYNPTNQSINISGWSIIDNYGRDFLESDFDHGNGSTVIPPFGYAIITAKGTGVFENFSVANDVICIYVDDKSIGNGLGNIGDKIILKDELNETIDWVEWIIDYDDLPGAPAKGVGVNRTLSRYKFGNDSSACFYEGFPTPGYENNIIVEGNISIDVEKKKHYMRKGDKEEITLTLKNLGQFKDNITLVLTDLNIGWSAWLEKNETTIEPNSEENITLYISPIESTSRYCNLTIIAYSEVDDNAFSEVTLYFELIGSDLIINNIKLYDESGNEVNSLNQGEIIKIKAFLKNIGTEIANNIVVGFYYDFIDEYHFIGSKYYDYVDKYQKYPSISWDTADVEPGFHTIIVFADIENSVEELDEDNNVLYFEIEILETKPSDVEKQIIITEFYYYTHPNINNEYIKIFNPSKEDIDISGWYITSEPLKSRVSQNKVIFPSKTVIESKSSLVLTQNASAYHLETGKLPNFEYVVDSIRTIPQMDYYKSFNMSNKGGKIVLKNRYNHTIDAIVYGDTDYDISGWKGKPIPGSKEGVVLRRKMNGQGNYIDTDTLNDWIDTREYRIGQSDLSYKRINFAGSIKTFFSPDCSFKVIVEEIRDASDFICINMYEFTNYFIYRELINALLRNVTVNLLVEGSLIGGIPDEEKYILKEIASYGGNVRFMKGDREKNIYRRYSLNHAKYIVIDGSTVIVESCNWVCTGVPIDPSFGNREWGVVIESKEVASYYLNAFLEDWDIKRCDVFSIDEINLEIPQNFTLKENIYNGSYNAFFESKRFVGEFPIYPLFSPDNSYEAIIDMLNSANESIYIEQFYIHKYWDSNINPFIDILVNKSKNGVDVKVIMNYNPYYEDSIAKCEETKVYLEENGIEVKYIFTNWSIIANVHNKGLIVDNKSVLISSINWDKSSFTMNRESGVIIENEDLARYYTEVFLHDWDLKENNKVVLKGKEKIDKEEANKIKNAEDNENKENSNFNTNIIYILLIFTIIFAIVLRDWRKRKWT